MLEVESKLGSQKSNTKRKFGNTATSPLHGTAKKQRMETDRPCTANRKLFVSKYLCIITILCVLYSLITLPLPTVVYNKENLERQETNK